MLVYSAPPWVDSWYELRAQFAKVDSAGFTGMIISGSPFSPSDLDPLGFPTKRGLLRVLDEAHQFGLTVVAPLPPWPTSHGKDNQGGKWWPDDIAHWILNQRLVQDWVRFFSDHPALAGWIVGQEMSSTTVATHIEGFPIRHWIRAAEEGTTYEAFRPLMAYTSNWAFKSDSWGGTSDPRARLKKIATAVDVILPNNFPIQKCCGNFENKTADITRIAVDAG